MDRIYEQEEIVTIAREVIMQAPPNQDHATIICLSGELGAGKTTVTQSIGALLGVKETIVSPTFVIAKFYTASENSFISLVHIDAYRIEHVEELVPLGFNSLCAQPQTLIIVEWPERIQEMIPERAKWFEISHIADKRHIKQK